MGKDLDVRHVAAFGRELDPHSVFPRWFEALRDAARRELETFFEDEYGEGFSPWMSDPAACRRGRCPPHHGCSSPHERSEMAPVERGRSLLDHLASVLPPKLVMFVALDLAGLVPEPFRSARFDRAVDDVRALLAHADSASAQVAGDRSPEMEQSD